MTDENTAALLGRIMAQSIAIELLLAMHLADKPKALADAVFATLRDTAKGSAGLSTLSEAGAVFMSDAHVHIAPAIEAMLMRTEALLATKPGSR